MEHLTSSGKAYYVNYQQHKETLTIHEGLVYVSLSGQYFKVQQNDRGFGYIMNQGQGMFLGSSQMS